MDESVCDLLICLAAITSVALMRVHVLCENRVRTVCFLFFSVGSTNDVNLSCESWTSVKSSLMSECIANEKLDLKKIHRMDSIKW